MLVLAHTSSASIGFSHSCDRRYSECVTEQDCLNKHTNRDVSIACSGSSTSFESSPEFITPLGCCLIQEPLHQDL